MTGELSALSAAMVWAVASILFAGVGRYIQAININLIKGILSCTMMLLVLAGGSLFKIEHLALSTLATIPAEDIALLLLSGIIGIGAGDTAYFACLRRIGPQNGLMLESTAPIIAALLAMLLFGELLPVVAWVGIVLTTFGVIFVIKWSQSAPGYRTSVSGILFGMLAALCQASGIVLSRKVLLSGEVEPLASALVRLFAALVIIAAWFLLRPHISFRAASRQSITETIALFIRHQLLLKVTGAIFLGTFLGIWLMQTSVKYTSAGVTQTLLATSPLFGMLLARLRGQTQVPRVWLGLLLGICGISLLFLS